MLSADQLAGMRNTVDAALPDVCTIVRLTEGAEDARGFSLPDAWVVRSEDVPCRLSPEKDPLVLDEDGVTVSRQSWMMTLPHGQAIEPSDVVRVGDEWFEVAGAAGDHSWKLSTRVRMVKRRTSPEPIVGGEYDYE